MAWTWTVLFGVALLAVGASVGFVLALLARVLMGSARPKARAPVGAVVIESTEEGGPPTLAPHQTQPMGWDPAEALVAMPIPDDDPQASEEDESLSRMPIPEYDPNESEDDVPTALYRHEDDDLDAALGELDTGDLSR